MLVMDHDAGDTAKRTNPTDYCVCSNMCLSVSWVTITEVSDLLVITMHRSHTFHYRRESTDGVLQKEGRLYAECISYETAGPDSFYR